MVSGDLDEFSIAALRADPVDSYGVGTSLVTGSGAPTASMVYKLVEVDGIPVQKRSSHKESHGGRKAALRLSRPTGTITEEIVHPVGPPADHQRAAPGADDAAGSQRADRAPNRTWPRPASWWRPGCAACRGRGWTCRTANPAIPTASHQRPAAVRLTSRHRVGKLNRDELKRTSHADLLADCAVAALGGSERRGQVEMATAVAHAFDTGEHLVVQAGTGTGKSLAYLVPAIVRAVSDDAPVVVSTATIALQRQLVDRDLPRLADSLADALPRPPRFALLKGRRNYLCLNKIHGGSAGGEDRRRPQEELFDPMAVTALGRDVQRLTAWAETTDTGDRDDLKPGVPDRSWSQVSVSARECIGVARCPFGSECFSERARGRAGAADIVVTNHALLAIDAVADSAVLPEHTLLVVDEAHELVDRVTSVATARTHIGRPRCRRAADRPLGAARNCVERLEAASATFSSAIHDASPGPHRPPRRRAGDLPDRAARRGQRGPVGDRHAPATRKAAAARAEAAAALTEIADTAARILTSFGPAIPDRTDVVWLDHEDNRGSPRAGAAGGAAVGGRTVARQGVHAATTVLTSATLTVGGSFDAMAAAWGLTGADADEAAVARA